MRGWVTLNAEATVRRRDPRRVRRVCKYGAVETLLAGATIQPNRLPFRLACHIRIAIPVQSPAGPITPTDMDRDQEAAAAVVEVDSSIGIQV
jgi:hypothetical protein